MLKRPKSDGRCIHCRRALVKATKDHVFPNSWYPDSTPQNVQRWTVPSCESCNGEFGEKEKQLLVRLALCVNPQKPEVKGLAKRALASLGIGVTGLSEKEMRIRKALREDVFKEAKLYTGENKEHVIPGLEVHPEAPSGQQLEIEIPGDILTEVTKKIVRGCEYWLSSGRIIEPPYEIEVLMVPAENLPPSVAQLVALFGRAHLGPGFRLRRGAVQDDSGAVLYEIVVWDTITFYCAILPPDAEAQQPNKRDVGAEGRN